MQFTDQDGTTLDLPKLTLSLREEKQRAAQLTEDAAKFRAQFSWLKKVLPTEYMAQAIDGDTVDDCDTTALGVLFIDVSEAYDAPLVAKQVAQMEKQAAAFDRMGKLIDSAAKIQGMNLGNSRQVFRAVK